MKLLRLILPLLICVSARPADSSLQLWFKFAATNSVDGRTNSGYILDSSGAGNHGLQFNPTNWVYVTNFHGRQCGRWETNVAPNNPNMTDASEFADGQVIPDSAVPSTGHKYAGGVYLAVTNLSNIHYLTNGTIGFWAYHVHKFLNSPTFVVDGAYDATGQSYTNCWRMVRVNADKLSFRCYSRTTTDSDGDALVSWPQDWVGGGNTGTDAWHHYAVAFNCTSNRMVAYYDGSPCATNTLALPPWFRIHGFSGYDWLAIGCANHSGSPQWGLGGSYPDRYPNDGFLSGALADLRIYNRELSVSEIAAWELGGDTTSTNLVLSGRVQFTGGALIR